MIPTPGEMTKERVPLAGRYWCEDSNTGVETPGVQQTDTLSQGHPGYSRLTHWVRDTRGTAD